VSRKDDPTDHIFVFFIEEPKVGVKSIKTVAERMRSDGVSRAIILIQEKITPFAKQSLSEMQPKYMIEMVRTNGMGSRLLDGYYVGYGYMDYQ